jgi:hypothetical protein
VTVSGISVEALQISGHYPPTTRNKTQQQETKLSPSTLISNDFKKIRKQCLKHMQNPWMVWNAMQP